MKSRKLQVAGGGILLSKEVKDVAQHAAVSLVDLRVAAFGADDCGESPILNVKYLAQKAAGRTELSRFILVIAALGTFEIDPHPFLLFACHLELRSEQGSYSLRSGGRHRQGFGNEQP